MIDMVERVARAMYIEHVGEDFLGSWEGLATDQKKIWLRTSRAAIKEMRKSAPEMTDATQHGPSQT